MRAYVQYNAIMLVRILADNPGPSFTRNLDSKFVSTVKELLRDGRDMSVQQILRETLDTFELQKGQDETLTPLISMWQNEKVKWAKRSGNDISSGLVSCIALELRYSGSSFMRIDDCRSDRTRRLRRATIHARPTIVRVAACTPTSARISIASRGSENIRKAPNSSRPIHRSKRNAPE